MYSIEDVLNDEMIQSGDTVALPPGGHLKSVFFSEEGVRLTYGWVVIDRILRYLIRRECYLYCCIGGNRDRRDGCLCWILQP